MSADRHRFATQVCLGKSAALLQAHGQARIQPEREQKRENDETDRESHGCLLIIIFIFPIILRR